MAKKKTESVVNTDFIVVGESTTPDGSEISISIVNAEDEIYHITCNGETKERVNGLEMGLVTFGELAAGSLTWEEITGTII